jgi:hypothetical protein
MTYEVVKLDSGHTLIHTRDDLLRDGCRVDIVLVEAGESVWHALEGGVHTHSTVETHEQ